MAKQAVKLEWNGLHGTAEGSSRNVFTGDDGWLENGALAGHPAK
jgi:hypothetical protein